MRVVLGRIALLLGVVIVGGMGWYGATALFGESDEDDRVSEGRDCEAATKRDARVARRTFAKEYVDKRSARWLAGFGVSETRALDSMASAGVYDDVPAIEGEGAFVLVMRLPGVDGPDLPECLRDVPIVVVSGGPLQFD